MCVCVWCVCVLCVVCVCGVCVCGLCVCCVCVWCVCVLLLCVCVCVVVVCVYVLLLLCVYVLLLLLCVCMCCCCCVCVGGRAGGGGEGARDTESKQEPHTKMWGKSTTLYYKSCTKRFPVLFCTTKLAQSTSQYYFVLQSLHRVLPSTCTKHVPVLLCTTNLAQSTSQYYFVLESLHATLPKTHQTLTQIKLFHTASFYTQQAFTTQRTRWHTASFYVSMRTATEDDINHAAIPLRYATADAKPPKTTRTHTQTHSKQLEATVTLRQRKNVRTTPAAPAAHALPFISGCSHFTRKTQGFVLRLPPQNQPHAKCTQPLQCVL